MVFISYCTSHGGQILRLSLQRFHQAKAKTCRKSQVIERTHWESSAPRVHIFGLYMPVCETEFRVIISGTDDSWKAERAPFQPRICPSQFIPPENGPVCLYFTPAQLCDPRKMDKYDWRPIQRSYSVTIIPTLLVKTHYGEPTAIHIKKKASPLMV